jgi:SAM-dependent methyltransferase
MLLKSLLLCLALCSVLTQAQFRLPRPATVKPQSLAPYVASPMAVVDRMLEMAKLKPTDTLYDLGSGDGRILFAAAQRFKAKAVGIELSERLVKSSQEEAKRQGLEENVTVIHADVFDTDLRKADVVMLYLMRDSNDTLRPKLEKELRPGTRVISHDYEIPGWKPALVEKADSSGRAHNIYLYIMPPQKVEVR